MPDNKLFGAAAEALEKALQNGGISGRRRDGLRRVGHMGNVAAGVGLVLFVEAGVARAKFFGLHG